jgi:hypothetical protein
MRGDEVKLTIAKARVPATPSLFAPDWGQRSNRIWEFITAAKKDELAIALDEILDSPASATASFDDLRLQFSASLLRDVLRAGGRVWVRDSRLLVSWPDWEGDHGRRNARAAMAAAREIRPLKTAELTRVQPMFAPDLDGDQLARVLAEGNFELLPASALHPSGITYGEAFSAALRYWTMPYRGRTGRMRRFVLTASHEVLGSHPIVAGILELGDEAPFCTWRDDLLGLSNSSLLEWIALNPKKNARLAARRLRSIRKCLNPTSRGRDLASLPYTEILAVRHKGTSKNRSYSSDATKLPAKDSVSFPFRFINVHSDTVSDRQRKRFFEVPIRLRRSHMAAVSEIRMTVAID